MKLLLPVLFVCLLTLVGACSSHEVRGELYTDTLKVMSEINYSVTNDVDNYSENADLYGKYKEIYTENLNAKEKELFNQLGLLFEVYEIRYSDEALLSSEVLKANDYENIYKDLYDLTSEIKEDQNL